VQPFDWRPLRLAKKVEAGAQFIQTQYCFDVPSFSVHGAVRDLGCTSGLHSGGRRAAALGQGGRVHAHQGARRRIPDEVVERLRQTPKERSGRGQAHLRRDHPAGAEIEGVAGVHVMAYRQEELVAEIIEEAGLLPRASKEQQEQAGRRTTIRH
jgi:methylenetetrahydrofolate reductase (NADPH)